MKHYIRYQVLNIPDKLRCEIRINIGDKSPEYTSESMTGRNTSITLYPIITLNITRPVEVDENGNRTRAKLNPNDMLSMTRYQLPLLIDELKSIENDMKTPELFTYQGKRLELNEESAKRIRKVFMIGTMTLELTAVVIVQPDESRVEGIKMKYNNEQSTVLLTLNDLRSLIFTLEHTDIDNIAMLLYTTYGKSKDKQKIYTPESLQASAPVVDIPPKEDFD